MLTEIDFLKNEVFFRDFVDELSLEINKAVGEKSTLKGKRDDKACCSQELFYSFGKYDIQLLYPNNSILRIVVTANHLYDLDRMQTEQLYSELLQFCKIYLKTQKINIFISLTLRLFSEKTVDEDLFDGAEYFSDSRSRCKAVPLSEELKNVQKLLALLSEYFPTKNYGYLIASGKGKLWNSYPIDLINEDGRIKIGLEWNKVKRKIGSFKEIQKLASYKKMKIAEIEKTKENTISLLKGCDPTFKHYQKNSVVAFGEKTTINAEYDVFKDVYLMMFLGKRIETQTLSEMQIRIDEIIDDKK